MHQMQPFEADIFKIFWGGAMPPDPPPPLVSKSLLPLLKGLQTLLPTTPAILPTTQKLFDWAAK